MDVRQLETFLAVVDHGGFNRAAAALRLAQPSLSQTIATLERDIGTRLFHRVGRKAVLTEAGLALIDPARATLRSLELARATVQAVSGLRGGRVDIAAMPSPAIEPLTGLITRFTSLHPEVSVLIRAAFTADDVIGQVRGGRAELGLAASTARLTAPGISSYPLPAQRLILVTPADGPFPAGAPVTERQLAGQRMIVVQQGTGMRTYLDDLKGRGVEWITAVEIEHRIAILPLVLGGVGLAVVPSSWRAFARQVGLLALDLDPAPGLQIALVSRQAGLTPAARAFLETALGPAAARR